MSNPEMVGSLLKALDEKCGSKLDGECLLEVGKHAKLGSDSIYNGS